MDALPAAALNTLWLQIMVFLATLFGQFKVQMASRMGPWEGIAAKTVDRFTLSMDEGIWLSFHART